MERATGISKTDASTVSALVLYTTITQNATSQLARSRYSPPVKSPGVKYVSGVLFFTRCLPKAAAKQPLEENKAEDVERGSLACSCFFDCSRNIVIAAAAFPRCSSPFELRLLSRWNWTTAKCRRCRITVSTEHITGRCFAGHAASPRDFLSNFWCSDGHASLSNILELSSAFSAPWNTVIFLSRDSLRFWGNFSIILTVGQSVGEIEIRRRFAEIKE